MEFKNHTPVAQIAMDFWRQYLRAQVMLSSYESALCLIYSRQLLSLKGFLKKAWTESFNARSGTGYEGWIDLRDSVTELVYAQVLFSTAIAALAAVDLPHASATHWNKINQNLASISLCDAKASGYIDEEGRYLIGYFKGEKAFSDKVISAGFESESGKWLHSIVPRFSLASEPGSIQQTILSLEGGTFPLPDLGGDSRCNDGIFPWVEYSAVFPSGLGWSCPKAATISTWPPKTRPNFFRPTRWDGMFCQLYWPDWA